MESSHTLAPRVWLKMGSAMKERLRLARENQERLLASSGGRSLSSRKNRLKRLKRVISSREGEILDALRKDLGKSPTEGYLTEISVLYQEIDLFLSRLEGWSRPRRVPTPLTLWPAKSRIVPEPYGRVLIIAPWNYPFQLLFSPLVGALGAGNTAVLKPSESAPATAELAASLVHEAFPEGEVVLFPGDAAITEALLEESWNYIFFTGSPRVGRLVMSAAAKHLTPLTLELGGKSPVVVDRDADLDTAAKRIAWGKFLNAGQTCVAPDYLYVHEGVAMKLVERIGSWLLRFYGKDPAESPDYGRIVSLSHFKRLTNLLEGTVPVLGGTPLEGRLYVPPTIVTGIEWEHPLMKEEIFGPILPVLTFSELDAALDEIRKRPSPLALYLFTRDRRKAEKALERLPFGGGCVNDTILHLANRNMPFGGVGSSGLGSYHGESSFRTFSHYKSILTGSSLFDIPLRYPPHSSQKLRWLKRFFSLL